MRSAASGLSLLPQGTPTNNTDTVSSAADRSDAADESFDDRKAPLFIPTSKWFDKKDGQWLAEALGIDPSLFAHVHHADATDQSAARAMNMAAVAGDVRLLDGIDDGAHVFARAPSI